MSTFQIEPLRDDDVDEVIAVINTAFGFDRSDDWYRWKHREGPWGPSTGVVARDGVGIVGVRLLLPWHLAGPAGTLTAHRAVEAATHPRARGRGVFSVVNRYLMEATGRGPASLIFSTPNQLSRSGYAKLGWSWLTPVPHVWRPVLPRRWRGDPLREQLDAVPGVGTGVPPGRIGTDWTASSLRWRIDPRSGHHYDCLVAPDGDAGLLHRPFQVHRLTTLLPLVAWGPVEQRRRLVGAAAARTGAKLVLDTSEPGGATVSARRGKRRGESLLAVWPTPSLSLAAWPLQDVANWYVGFADLEDVL
jgi:hypothetical protein